MSTSTVLSRAQGCLVAQIIGDSLGSLVEFLPADQIVTAYPDGVHDLALGGRWNLLPGQPTDDSELALALARSLVRCGEFDKEDITASYQRWLDSDPFDVGHTTRQGLTGAPNEQSQANGALMRVSPLGVWGVRHALDDTRHWARQDAAITHPNPVCLSANELFTAAISVAIRDELSPSQVYEQVIQWTDEWQVAPSVREVVRRASEAPPDDYVTHMGWVLIALQNAFWQLVHAPNLEEALIDTVGRGGDTDTNAAICGALLGAVYGVSAVPDRWLSPMLACRPSVNDPDCEHPRPEEYWPVDVLQLAEQLLSGEAKL